VSVRALYVLSFWLLHYSHATNFDCGEPAQAGGVSERRNHLRPDRDVLKLASSGATFSGSQGLKLRADTIPSAWFNFAPPPDPYAEASSLKKKEPLQMGFACLSRTQVSFHLTSGVT